MTKFYRFWLIALAIKAILAIWLPFSSDEAYYWVWGHHLQFSYFDHPPMVAWLFALGRLFDFVGQASRLPAVILGHCTLLVWNGLLRPYLDEKQMSYWLGFVLLSPFLGIGSLIVTPDLPLVFFWSLGILALLKAIKTSAPPANTTANTTTDKPRYALRYAALGAVLGLGFCAKYHMVLFVPIAWIWLAFSGRWRDIKWAYIPIAIIVGFIACAPVWGWNAANDWVSFRFQLEHGLKGANWKPSWPLEYALGQILLIFPPILWFALRRREPKEASWLHAFAWLPLLFFLYTSFKARVEANWPIVAHPAILSLAFLNSSLGQWAKHTTNALTHNPLNRWLRTTMAIWALALVAVISQVAVPWIPLEPRKLKTSEFQKFDVLLPAVSELKPLYAGSYQMASALSYKTHQMIYKLGGMNRRDFYDFQPMAYPNSEVFYVAVEGDYPLPAWIAEKGLVTRVWKQVSPELQVLEVRRRAENTDP